MSHIKSAAHHKLLRKGSRKVSRAHKNGRWCPIDDDRSLRLLVALASKLDLSLTELLTQEVLPNYLQTYNDGQKS